MKKNTHPPYQDILIVDSATGDCFVCGSTLQLKTTEKHNGKDYPVLYVSTSSILYPLFMGSKQLVDAEVVLTNLQTLWEKKNRST